MQCAVCSDRVTVLSLNSLREQESERAEAQLADAICSEFMPLKMLNAFSMFFLAYVNYIYSMLSCVLTIYSYFL